jgi:signal transduction histidine kinase
MLTLGVGVSIIATSVVSRWEISNRQLRFQRQRENLGTALQRSLNRYMEMLTFLNDYYNVNPHSIERQAFAEFVGRSLQVYPGIQALEWAPLVRHTERLAYEEKMQQQGYSRFQITELGEAGNLVAAVLRPYYIPVTYVEPLAGNESALGFDLHSNLKRAMAIAQARDTGAITATGRIRLVQEKRDQFGFLVFLSIYQNRQIPPSLAMRQQQFSGVLLGVFRVSDVVEESLRDLQSEIDIAIYDRNATPNEQFLGRYDAVQKRVTPIELSSSQAKYSFLCPSVHSCTQTLNIGQRQWLITFSPSENYLVEPRYGAIATLITGLLLTSGLVLFLYQLNREIEQTQYLSDLRFQFFSMASHELRTPLSTILLSSELLQLHQDELTPEQKQTNIQRINATAKHMSQQIADLLLWTRAESGKLEFQPELLDLEEFCQQIVEEMQPGIAQRINLTHPRQGIKAFLDKKLLRSLLTNLLSNAAKYSPADAPIQLTLNCNATTAIVQVGDRGIGIPSIDQPRILDAFYRGSNVGEATGTGLGLAIVKTCVELHKGTWQIESVVGEGTRVTVKLPLE